MKQVHIRINEQTHKRLRRLSRKLGVSMAALAQLAVTKYHDEQKQARKEAQ